VRSAAKEIAHGQDTGKAGNKGTRGQGTTGPTHLNFSGKTVTALILIEWFGSPTQMISSRFAPQGASFFRRKLHSFSFRDPNWAQSVVPNRMTPHINLEN